MGDVFIGTTSWTEKTLIKSGEFYPSSAKTAEDRLRYYARQFSIVEVDSSYYGLPSERNSRLWVKRTPDQFTFDIKAFRLFTRHQTPLSAFPKDMRSILQKSDKTFYYDELPEEFKTELWDRFASAIEPVRKVGKLGVVLFQFPPWFVCKKSSFEHILHCKERLNSCQLAIEFRHRSWFEKKHRDDVIKFERDNDLAHVVVDEPQGFKGSVPGVWEVTSRIAIVRLHGRNRDMWTKKGLKSAADRFNYLYSKQELTEFVQPIQAVAENAERVHVLFNNCYRDYAQKNAATLRKLLAS